MKFLLTLFSLGCVLHLSAADSTVTWNDVMKSFKKKEVSIETIKPAIEKKVVQQIEVLDVRSDTNRIGMFADMNYKPHEIVFENTASLENVIQTKLADEQAADKKVLLVVQDFWLNEIKAEKIIDKENQTKPVIHTSKIVCRLDVFVKENNSYYPLTRVDTTLWDKRAVAISSKYLLAEVLTIIHSKIENSLAVNTYHQRKNGTKEEIYAAYEKRFSYPAFNINCLKKGVYTSIDEFKNNHPYAEHFVIKSRKNEAPSLYVVDANGNEVISRNAWGVCDGKNMYIMQQGMLFKLYKNANAFYWMGVKYLDLRMYDTPKATPLNVGAEVGMEEPVATNVKIRLTPYLLRPETGEGY